MKKQRIVFSHLAVLLLMMLLSISVSSVFAEETTGVTTVTFTKTFGDEGDVIPQEIFDFGMVPDESASGTTEDGLTIYPGVWLEMSYISKYEGGYYRLLFNNQTGNVLQGEFEFGGTFFPYKGAYRYKVYEYCYSQEDYIVYDDTVYTVDIIVGNDSVVQGTRVVAVNDEPVADSKTPIEFVNTFESDSLTIRKTVSGNMADKDKAFEFSIDIPRDSGILDMGNTSPPIPYVIYRADGTKEEGNFIVGSTENRFSLADGDELVFESVPVGMLYTIEEKDYSDEGYITSVTGSFDSGNRTVSLSETTAYNAKTEGTPVSAGGNVIEFINHNEMIILTGVFSDLIPSFVLFGLALFGFSVFLMRKWAIRRKT